MINYSVIIKLDDRKSDFKIASSYTDVDVSSFTIPEGYKVEFIPKDQVIKSDFGECSYQTVLKDGKLVYTRTQRSVKKRFPANRYNEYVDFYKSIYKADKQKAIFAKAQ